MDVTKTSGAIETYASLSGTLSTQITEVIETADYDQLQNLPTINGVLLKGDMTSEELGIERGYDAHVDEEDEEHLILTT